MLPGTVQEAESTTAVGVGQVQRECMMEDMDILDDQCVRTTKALLAGGTVNAHIGWIIANRERGEGGQSQFSLRCTFVLCRCS